MAVRYIAGTEDVAKLVNVPFDQEDSWWGGVFQNAASVALASALAVTLSTSLSATVTTSHQDELGSTVAALTIDEQYWQNQIPPTSSVIWQALPLGIDSEFAAVAAVVPDEDLWVNLVAPLQGGNTWPQPWTFDAPESVAAPLVQLGESDWINPVPPVAGATVWLPWPWVYETEFVLPQISFLALDDYWLNPVASVPSVFWTLPVFGFDFDVSALYSLPRQVLAALNARGVPQLVMFSKGVLVVGRTVPHLADTSGRVVASLTSLGGRVIY